MSSSERSAKASLSISLSAKKEIIKLLQWNKCKTQNAYTITILSYVSSFTCSHMYQWLARLAFTNGDTQLLTTTTIGNHHFKLLTYARGIYLSGI